jgi:hypothetical protein
MNTILGTTDSLDSFVVRCNADPRDSFEGEALTGDSYNYRFSNILPALI